MSALFKRLASWLMATPESEPPKRAEPSIAARYRAAAERSDHAEMDRLMGLLEAEVAEQTTTDPWLQELEASTARATNLSTDLVAVARARLEATRAEIQARKARQQPDPETQIPSRSPKEEQRYQDLLNRAERGDNSALVSLINYHASRGEDAEVARLHGILDPSTDWARERQRGSWGRFLSPSTGGRAGTVYVIQDISTGLYKIGITTNMQRRMRELGVGTTARLVEQKQVSDARAVEKAAHKRYKAQRLPQTEYFRLDRPPTI
jgi:hypothetical protein